MAEATAWAFFSGSFKYRAVLARQEVALGEAEVARLPSFAIRMQPLSNVVPTDDACVYGILVRLTHCALGHLYHRLPDAAGGYLSARGGPYPDTHGHVPTGIVLHRAAASRSSR